MGLWQGFVGGISAMMKVFSWSHQVRSANDLEAGFRKGVGLSFRQVVGLGQGLSNLGIAFGISVTPSVFAVGCQQVRISKDFEVGFRKGVGFSFVKGIGLCRFLLPQCCRGGPRPRFNPLSCTTLTMQTANGFQQSLILVLG